MKDCGHTGESESANENRGIVTCITFFGFESESSFEVIGGESGIDD